ncbi:MAG: AzlC family ABC transporter permease [Deltaproteobacteria bacterium]|nr:AzlC family ABC transporter permease [Deltaproteobacteria bacterium]
MKHVLKQGFMAAWPICTGYIAIGLAFGVLAQQARISVAEIALMSVCVFAGSSQFIAVSMLSSGAGILAIITTTFMVNLRHLLMSSSLAIHLKGRRIMWLSAFAYGITDETFAVNLTKFQQNTWNPSNALAVNFISNLCWIGSTILGGYAGQFIPPGAFGIDYALIAMFLCLLVFQLRGNIFVAVAIIAGVLSVCFSLLIPGNSYVILASVTAAFVGVFLIRIKNQSTDGLSAEET